MSKRNGGWNKTHGEIRKINGQRIASPEYRSWQMMKNRCLNKKSSDYHHYGGRGITIDPSWLYFENFLADMGRRPCSTDTLERINTNGDYSKSNCIWATRKTQSRNRNYCKLNASQANQIRIYYKQGYLQTELAKMFKVSQGTISRIVRNVTWA